jgi:hemerythrin-like metal-binding protein
MRYRDDVASDEDLRLDLPSIDFEHALQVDLVDALGRSVAEGKSREVADEILEKLLDLTRVHFLAEELMMRMEGYPGYEAHLGEHGELLTELRSLRSALQQGGPLMTRDAAAGLRSWLTGHIRTQDRALAAFLASRAGGAAGP